MIMLKRGWGKKKEKEFQGGDDADDQVGLAFALGVVHRPPEYCELERNDMIEIEPYVLIF